MSNEYRFSVEDGKYTFVKPANDYRVHVLRHGDPWIIIENGCKAVFSLLYDAISDRALVEAVRRWAAIGPSGFHHGELAAAFRAYLAERGERPRDLVVDRFGVEPTSISPWRTDAPPRGVRCLVTARSVSGEIGVLLASVSPDHDGTVWFGDSVRLYEVIAWMPCPEPAAVPDCAQASTQADSTST